MPCRLSGRREPSFCPNHGITSATSTHLLDATVGHQQLDLVDSNAVDSTYTLLLDCSQSMSRRMDFVQEAANRLLRYLRPKDRVIVAPFTKTIGSITGPTDDRRTVTTAIATTQAGGGTALLDALTELPRLLQGAAGRQAVVLVTDGYDEDSTFIASTTRYEP